MKRSVVFSGLVLVLFVSGVRAQPGSAEVNEALEPSPQPPKTEAVEPDFGRPGRVWASAEYLLWCVKASPLPALLTTSPTGTPVERAGVLGDPSTAVLFGGESENGGARSGGRFTLGVWLDEQETCGIEGSYFLLEQHSKPFAASSPGNPILARPFFDVTRPGPRALLVAFPGLVAGTFLASVTNDVSGGDVNLRVNLCRDCVCRLDLLAGYRCLNFDEDLRINEREIATDPNLPPGTTFDLFDGFRTRNTFQGGQVGLAGEACWGRVILQAVGKLAIGTTNREVEILGATQEVGAPAVSGGFLASGTNIGRYTDSRFSVVSELNINVGYQVLDCLRVFAGYTFLCWTEVARPGNQIDLGVNPTQLPPGVLQGEARPAFQFRNSDVWLQGVSFGLECRF